MRSMELEVISIWYWSFGSIEAIISGVLAKEVIFYL